MIVLWRITERCNLACPFCACSRDLERPRQQTPAAEIRRVTRLLGDWQDHTGTAVLLSWLGGEPFLRADLTSLTEFAVHGCGLRVSTTTNGTALGSSALREHILSCYAELTVSVDGLADTHERLRGWPGGFTTLRENVRRLAAARGESRTPLLRVNTVLLHGTVTALPALCQELSGWGIDEITFNQLGGIERPDFHAANRLLPDDVATLRALLPPLRDGLAGRGIRLMGSGSYLDRIEATARGHALPVAGCGPGERFLFVDENGLVSPCAFTSAEYGVPLADLRSVSDLDALPARFRAARRQRCAAACGDCHSTQMAAKFQPIHP